jgi:Ni,Fe-hydrogenase III small subunit
MIPVSAYIPGCPASPMAIMDGVVKLLAGLEAQEKGSPPAPPANLEEPEEADEPPPSELESE